MPAGILTTFAGGGSVTTGEGIAASSALPGQMSYVGADRYGTIYFIDFDHRYIRKVLVMI
jgi:hypothetical protein